jgi:hypothetical protein
MVRGESRRTPRSSRRGREMRHFTSENEEANVGAPNARGRSDGTVGEPRTLTRILVGHRGEFTSDDRGGSEVGYRRYRRVSRLNKRFKYSNDDVDSCKKSEANPKPRDRR